MEDWLARFPGEINGVWAANDMMGLGALEALRAAGLSKTVPVVGIDGVGEAIVACITGEFVATVMNDPMWQGGHGLSLAWHAYKGAFDPAKEPKEHREFYFEPVLVNKDNAAEVKHKYIDGTPHYDYEDLWGRVAEPITYPTT